MIPDRTACMQPMQMVDARLCVVHVNASVGFGFWFGRAGITSERLQLCSVRQPAQWYLLTTRFAVLGCSALPHAAKCRSADW